jgi:hypothetical protein
MKDPNRISKSIMVDAVVAIVLEKYEIEGADDCSEGKLN